MLNTNIFEIWSYTPTPARRRACGREEEQEARKIRSQRTYCTSPDRRHLILPATWAVRVRRVRADRSRSRVARGPHQRAPVFHFSHAAYKLHEHCMNMRHGHGHGHNKV